MTGALAEDSTRLFLSPPDCGDREVEAVKRAVASGWVAPIGPEVDAFEADIASFCGRSHAVALSSGTAALHLGLMALGVQPGSEVVVPTLTFGATAFAVVHAGASPVFLDVDSESWNLDPDLLAQFLAERAAAGSLPAAVVPVDVFGRTADYDRILSICQQYEVPVLADAAESLGAMHGDRPAGSLGKAAVFSFNGNKIITTSGGGMLVTDDLALATKVRFWSTQSREPLPWYEHEEIGYNYRMSNILAALGRAQLSRLPEMIERRRSIRDRYSAALGSIEGVAVMGDPHWGLGNGWLSTVTFDPAVHPDAPRRVREALEVRNIESRPIWKPMHLQPVFSNAQTLITGVADQVFETGLCLPSGSSMTSDDCDRVVQAVVAELENM